MRYIKIPNDVTLTKPDGSAIEGAKPVKFTEWLRTSVLIDPKLGKSAKDVMMASDIRKQVIECAEGMPDIRKQGDEDAYLELSDAEWDAMKLVVEEPTNGYNVSIAIQLVSFMRSFLDATDADPRKELKEVPAQAG